ncbi:MAG: DsrE family protein [Pseudomonadota bacterium]
MRMARQAAYFLSVILMSLTLAATARAAEINDADALRGMKTGKGVFLVDIGDPNKLAFYLEVIQGTHAGFVRQGVKPDLILVYIGPSVRYLTTAPDADTALEHEDALKRIAASVRALKALGVRQEICAVATKAFNIDNTTVLPELKLVGDGFISLIGYQNQGYHLVPVF